MYEPECTKLTQLLLGYAQTKPDKTGFTLTCFAGLQVSEMGT